MEVDTISKNGRSSKSHTSRRNFSWVITALFVVIFSIVACGGGSGSKSSKIPNGTYVSNSDYDEPISITFSGNKVVIKNGNVTTEGTYELVEEYKEKDFSRGVLIVKTRDDEINSSYSLEGNELRYYGTVFIKK